MPFYDYKCKYCKIEKEIFEKTMNNNSIYCNICEKKSLIKIISRTSFVLKGKGWYETDFKSKKNNGK